MGRWLHLLLVLAVILTSGSARAQDTTAAEPEQSIVTDPSHLPGGKLAPGWYVRIETSEGRIVGRLHPEQAPQSVAHFAALAEGRLEWTDAITGEKFKKPYYDGQLVYRAEAGRSFESGDPHGTGTGSPEIWVPAEVNRPVNFTVPWRIGLTRAPLGRISGCQFFVTAASLPELNHRHPVIGTVIEGKQVVRGITEVRTYGNDRPVEPVAIHSIRIIPYGDPEPLEEPAPYSPPSDRRLRVKEGLSDRDR